MKGGEGEGIVKGGVAEEMVRLDCSWSVFPQCIGTSKHTIYRSSIVHADTER